MLSINWFQDILDFWFKELEPKQWYSGSNELDTIIKQRFEPTVLALAKELPVETETNPHAALAAVIALDQFSRNIYRKSAAAFANDATATQLARATYEREHHKAMDGHELQFLFMPFMHSENIDDQNFGVERFTELGNENTVKYAIEHRDVIKQFGRFPHRNTALSRSSTAEEIEYLKEANTYGQ
ncbi:MAG: DUF924 domain-containing protein [Gammaproteobacteria bacterium]|nr:DUF924 domain-containing protein [Gammaproteobacteria bacterium]